MVENDFSTPENERRFSPKKDHISKEIVIFDMLGFRGVYMIFLVEISESCRKTKAFVGES